MNVQDWNSSVSNNKKLSLYKSVKSTFVYENYLDVLDIRKFRYCYVNFRIGSHSLGVEHGFFKNAPPSVRICKCCSLNCIEDELHFLLVCDNYTALRNKYIPSFYYEQPNLFRMKLLMSCENPDIVKSVATYLYHAFQRRKLTVSL